MKLRCVDRHLLIVVFLGAALMLASGCEDETLQVNRLSRQSGVPGENITIYGSGFQSGGARTVRVFFGGHKAQKVKIKGNKEIQVEVPGGPTMGTTVDLVLIFDPGGEVAYPAAFRYSEPARTTVDDLLGASKED